ncbi:DUF2255 family protein [Mycobacterium sp. ITM-2016-00317]|uniref:DUF2255 family protein n=1 Tax=Mycobacterium sp. ITM-2016-00317 TaxID=2099694 RepID=UPI000D466157|nr:DUF2255 family protein [Mycobacterium sp. ITM-2016-00317]WNG86477.1 DUF2255 family protein [Mycobacterium sp. ITM-2016-00317]
MTRSWPKDQLDRLGAAEEIRIAGRRRDGSLRRPVIVWVVRIGDELFTRSVNGADAGWFRGTRARHEGHVSGGGVEADVDFLGIGDVDDIDHGALHNAVDAAYRSKYAKYRGPVAAITSPMARATTLKLLPQTHN